MTPEQRAMTLSQYLCAALAEVRAKHPAGSKASRVLLELAANVEEVQSVVRQLKPEVSMTVLPATSPTG